MSDSTPAFILVPAGPHAGAWAKDDRSLSILQNGRPYDRQAPIWRGTQLHTCDGPLPLQVSPSPEHWAKLLALVIVDQSRAVIL